MPKFINPTNVITGPDARWSYANIWEAKSINGGAPKFSVSLIIPKVPAHYQEVYLFHMQIYRTQKLHFQKLLYIL